MSTRPAIAVIGRRSRKVAGLRFAATVAAEAVCDAVFEAGGEPLVLHGGPRQALDGLPGRLASFAGVVVPGGSDLDPAHYGQRPHPRTEPDDPEQDRLDLAVLRAVVARRIPTLAICRGMQALNVVCGGTLDQHLTETSVTHMDALHEVTAEPGSHLASVVGTAPFKISSYHHQAVDRVGRDLRVVARAADGCVEALEHTTADVLAVQWHPEDLAGTSPQDGALFTDLVERARTRKEPA